MNRRISEAAFKKALFARVRLARLAAGLEPSEVASALGISRDQYVRYESRYVLRADLIAPFCELVGITPDVLFKHPEKSPQQRLQSVE